MDEIATVQAEGAVTSRDDVVAALRRHEAAIRGFGATALYLFGSAARDEMRPNSDIDVFIDYDRDGSFTFVELIRLEDYLQEILGRRVDFATRDGLHKRLRQHIEETCLRVF